MDERLILETTFLVDLESEGLRRTAGPAIRFLEARPTALCFVTPTILGDVACGMSLASRDRWRYFVEPFGVLSIDEEVCWHYGEAYRALQAAGLLIGANDLWIAATAKSHGLPVVTRNLEHYRRVAGLQVVGYC